MSGRGKGGIRAAKPDDHPRPVQGSEGSRPEPHPGCSHHRTPDATGPKAVDFTHTQVRRPSIQMVFVNEDDLGPDDGYSLIKRNKGKGKKSRPSGGQKGGGRVWRAAGFQSEISSPNSTLPLCPARRQGKVATGKNPNNPQCSRLCSRLTTG